MIGTSFFTCFCIMFNIHHPWLSPGVKDKRKELSVVMHELFLLGIGKNQNKKRKKEPVFSFLSFSFLLSEEGGCINFFGFMV